MHDENSTKVVSEKLEWIPSFKNIWSWKGVRDVVFTCNIYFENILRARRSEVSLQASNSHLSQLSTSVEAGTQQKGEVTVRWNVKYMWMIVKIGE